MKRRIRWQCLRYDILYIVNPIRNNWKRRRKWWWSSLRDSLKRKRRRWENSLSRKNRRCWLTCCRTWAPLSLLISPSPGPTLKRDQNQELEQEERREKEDYFGSRRHDSDRYERPSSRDMFREGRNGYGREGQVSYQTISASVPVRSSFPADIRRESVDSPRILNSYHSAGEGFYE